MGIRSVLAVGAALLMGMPFWTAGHAADIESAPAFTVGQKVSSQAVSRPRCATNSSMWS